VPGLGLLSLHLAAEEYAGQPPARQKALAATPRQTAQVGSASCVGLPAWVVPDLLTGQGGGARFYGDAVASQLIAEG
jgi:hypothetical protein